MTREKPADGQRFPETSDLCIGFWALHWNRGDLHFPFGARVLEIGCAEGNWLGPMHTARPDLDLVGLDVRQVDRPGAIVGDILTYDFPPASFDAIVAVSSIEHVGLGHYGDPKDVDGDTHAMQRATRWLKPGGWVYLDVPYREQDGAYQVHGSSFRAYDPPTVISRLIVPGLVVRQALFQPGPHADGPFVSLILDRVED